MINTCGNSYEYKCEKLATSWKDFESIFSWRITTTLNEEHGNKIPWDRLTYGDLGFVTVGTDR